MVINKKNLNNAYAYIIKNWGSLVIWLGQSPGIWLHSMFSYLRKISFIQTCNITIFLIFKKNNNIENEHG